MPPVRIPVAAGAVPPRVCLRHGRPARTMTPMVFLSRPPFWLLVVLILVGWLVYSLIAARARRSVAVPAWPWCGRCDLTRLGRAALGVLVLLAGLLTAVRLGDSFQGRTALLVLAGTLLTMIAGLVLLVRSTRGATCGVRVSRDGEWLELRRPHERFLAALREQPAPRYPMPAGWTVPATAAPSAVWAPAPAAAVADRTPPVASPMPTAPGGWTPPSA
ncbi:hypothetical protein AB0K00_24780 [Dactylosporangium sp. NPDC049525]|uniref:hypothetical protein n=1 Tax=Dactylosporangium sp. NPDC049525 TaxID=3154730 RepID=UPI00341B8664